MAHGTARDTGQQQRAAEIHSGSPNAPAPPKFSKLSTPTSTATSNTMPGPSNARIHQPVHVLPSRIARRRRHESSSASAA